MKQPTTPCLLLDTAKMERNIGRMRDHLVALGVPLRPHLKTCKSIDVARRILDAGNTAGITVSTLAEADYFFGHGMRDILYAVGIAPGKLEAAAGRLTQGMELGLILDHPDAARAVAEGCRRLDAGFRLLLEVDADGQRAGFHPDDAGLLKAADELTAAGCTVAGVMVHAGGSYNCRDTDCIRKIARDERDAAVTAAKRLRAHGLEAPVVSVGSTPTAAFATDLSGVTEVRAGVYVFQDLVMAGLGVCEIEDIAISVLIEVIGHRDSAGEILVDAGWMALSRDRGTAGQALDQGYGLVCDADGEPLNDVIVTATNQEHGIIGRRDGGPLELSEFPIGSRLRVLPNHACATAAQHAGYRLIGPDGRPGEWWPRIGGW